MNYSVRSTTGFTLGPLVGVGITLVSGFDPISDLNFYFKFLIRRTLHKVVSVPLFGFHEVEICIKCNESNII